MSETQIQSPDSGRSQVLGQLLMSVVTVGMLMLCWLAFAFMAFGSTWSDHAAPVPTPNSDPDPQPTPVIEKTDEPLPPKVSESEYTTAERVMLLKLQRIELDPRLNALRTQLDNVEQQATGWQRRISELMTSSEGRRLAVEDSALRVRFLDATVQAELSRLAGVREWLNDIQQNVSRSRGPISTYDQIETRALESQSSIAAVTGIIEQAESMLDQMVSKASDPQDRTLEAFLATLEQQTEQSIKEEVKRRLDAMEVTHAAESKAANDNHSTSKTVLEKSEKKLESARKESTERIAESEKSVEAEQATVAARNAELRKKMEAKLPGMRSLLSPFITPGYRQPRWESYLEVVPDKAPMSFSALQRVRALEDSKKGMELLLMLADKEAGFYPGNDRPAGDFPIYQGEGDIQRPEILETLKVVQDFLRTYGEVMVEANLLSP